MYIQNIKLKNYRNYEDFNLDFGKKATVLIGKNGMGKTNMITALKQSLSSATIWWGSVPVGKACTDSSNASSLCIVGSIR